MQKNKLIGAALVFVFLIFGVVIFFAEEEVIDNETEETVITETTPEVEIIPDTEKVVSKYAKNSFAKFVEESNDPVLKEKFSDKDLDEGFCFSADNINGEITVKCYQPSTLIDETGEFKEVLDATQGYENNDEDDIDEVAEDDEQNEIISPEDTKLDPEYIDNKKYVKETMANYIQERYEIKQRFKGKELSDEFCFEKEISETKSTIKCLIPSELLDAEDIYFDKILDDILALKRDDTIQTVPFTDLSETKQVYVKVHDFVGEDYLDFSEKLKEKQKTGTANKSEIKAVYYLYGLEGDYAKSEEIAEYNCENFEVQCEKDTSLFLEGTVTDAKGNPVPSATIEVLSDAVIPSVQTDYNGKYQIELDVYEFSKVRIKASKLGYSEGVIPLNIVDESKKTISKVDFVLNAPINVVTLNNKTKTFAGNGVTIENNAFIVQTEWNKYMIPFNALVHRDGTPFYGEVSAFLFEFDKSSDIDTLLANDIFDEVVGYAGNLMKTFGMPYVLFKTNDGSSIHVQKSNPMILQTQIIEMEALYTNQDRIYRPLTEEDMQYLFDKSQALGGYPIDRDLLINPERLMVHFPAFWVFDQVTGVWENVGIKLLNTTGLMEVTFYTLNDL